MAKKTFSMVKKTFIISLAISCLELNVFAQSPVKSIEITDITFNGNNINVETSLSDKSYDNVKIVVSKSDADTAGNVVWISEEESEPNGEKVFDFIMPDTKNGADTTGEYKILVKTNGSEISTATFNFVSSGKRAETIALIESMNGDDASDFKELFADGSIHKNAITVMGVPVKVFDGLTDANKTVCAEKFLEAKPGSLTEDTFRKTFTDVLSVAAINAAGQDDISELLELANPEYDGVAFCDITDASLQAWIPSVIYDERPYSDAAKLADSYKTANVLYKLNNAKYSDLEKLFSDNAETLGISGKDYYITYCAMDSNKRVDVNERIVRVLDANPARKCSAVASAMSSAVSAVKNQNTQTSTGGGGGGGISSGSGKTEGVSLGVSTGGLNSTGLSNGIIGGTGSANAEGYTDLSEHAWAEEAILALSDKGIVSGTGNGQFEPGRNITREEFVKIIVLAAQLGAEEADARFTDVTESDWYYSYVQRAVKAGIINGKSDTLFGAGEPLTRQDMVVIAYRACDRTLPSVREEANFTDADMIADYAADIVYKTYAAGLIDGFDDNSFRPYERCTRAMAAKVIYNMFVNPEFADMSVAKDDETQAGYDSSSKYAEELALLSSLDIYEAKLDEERGFNDTENISFEEFVGAVVRMKLGKPENGADYMLLGVEQGLIGAEDKTRAASSISCNEAVRIVLKALNYADIAEHNGGYPQGYAKVAGEIDLLDNSVKTGEDPLTAGNMLKLLVNAIDVPIAKIDLNKSNSYRYEQTDGETILSEYRDIYKVEGMVNKNSFTSLNSTSSLRDNEVEIGDTVFNDSKYSAQELLGKYIYAYAADNNGSYEILFAAADKRKNKEIEVLAKDLVSLDDKCTLLVYERDGERKKNAKISLTRRVIYNGVIYNNFTKDDILIKSGSIRLLDNDNDGVYDIIFVTSYDADMFVSYVSTYEKIIYNQYKNSSVPPYIELFEDDGINRNIILLDGKEIKLADIRENDVVSVALSKNQNKNVARVYVSRNSVQGTLTSYNESNLELSLMDDNGKVQTYDVSSALIDELNSPASTFEKLITGREYVFYLDIQGKVVGAVTNNDTDWQPVMLLKIYKEEETDDADVSARYLTVNDEWKTAKLYNKIEYQNSTSTPSDVYDKLADNGNITPQVAMIKTDSEGVIRKLRVATVTDEANKNLLTVKNLDSAIARPSGAFGDFEYFRKDDAVVFIMPSITSYDMDDYSISGSNYFETNDTYYDLKLYNLDEYKFTNLISVRKGSDNSIDGKPLFLISNILQEVNDEGDVVYNLYGSMENLSMVSAEIADSNLITDNNISKGDVIQATTDKKGRIDNIRVIYHIDDGKSIAPALSRWDEPQSITFKGTVDKIDGLKNRMVIRFDDGSTKTIRFWQNTTVNVYDEKSKEIVQQKVSDIREGDFIVARMNEMILQSIAVIRFND